MTPVLYVSHGAPLFALDPGVSGAALQSFTQSLESRPKAVVIMSPHWMPRSPAVMTGAQPATLHDFGGFPDVLYQLQYPAPGAPVLAAQVIELLAQAGISAQGDAQRPLDHGVWVPLMHMFADAQVPVLQVALPQRAGPREVYAMGAALQSLRQQGVLLVGSGGMTHNLGEFAGPGVPTAPYVLEFSRWVEGRIAQADLQALCDYRQRAPHALRAHPSEDHFMPLFFALGAGGVGSKAHYLSREVLYGMLAMDSFYLQ
jgi:4,5-DOPA dioxygenase extradiol